MEFIDGMTQIVLLVVIGELNIPRVGASLQRDAYLVKGAPDVVARRDVTRLPINYGQSTLVDAPNTGKLSLRF